MSSTVNRRFVTGLAVAGALGAVAAGAVQAAPAQALTKSGYPNAQVQFRASARERPYLRYDGRDTYRGYVTAQPGTGSGNQTSAVSCWYDGDWATGNYSTNRWFRVYVATDYSSGYWYFVHASYVYNQPAVRQCSVNGGIWY